MPPTQPERLARIEAILERLEAKVTAIAEAQDVGDAEAAIITAKGGAGSGLYYINGRGAGTPTVAPQDEIHMYTYAENLAMATVASTAINAVI